MTDDWVSPRAGARRHGAIAAFLTIGALLAACSPTGRSGSTLRTFAADLAGGAKVCEVPEVSPGKAADLKVAIKVVNDGGWCGIRLHQPGPEPYAAGLLTARANHGNVTIHSVGDDTRIDYTPDRGYVGNDEFRVKLIPGDVTLNVSVAVMGTARA